MAKTRDATRILNDVTGDDEELQQMIAEETVNAEVARLIYEARKMAGLTQTELAELIGSKNQLLPALRMQIMKAIHSRCFKESRSH